jgi:hypothetical protein
VYVAGLVARHRIPGLEVAVSRDSVCDYARGFGYADVERRVPATPDTAYGGPSGTRTTDVPLIRGVLSEPALLKQDAGRHS